MNPHLIDQTVELINAQWPRSRGARLNTLNSSSDRLPCCLVATKNKNQLVVGHVKITPVPSEKTACFLESVVVAKSLRGQGIGTQLMQEAESYCKSTIGVKTVYLSTFDKQSFYLKLGYEICEPISIFGTRNFGVNSATKKTYMKKELI